MSITSMLSRMLISNIKLPIAPSAERCVSYLASKELSVENLERLVAELDVLGRWQVVSASLTIVPNRVVHFFHIPKTGGTTFGETLSRDARVAYIAVDASVGVFAKSLLALKTVSPEKLVMTRAHHSLRVLFSSGVVPRFDSIISFYRPPLDIHVSNVNMIIRRLQKHLDGITQTELEKEFCDSWLKRLDGHVDISHSGALSVISSSAYISEMGNIYKRFFNVFGWRTLVRDKKLIVVSHDNIDTLFTEVLGYDFAPERRNVSEERFITTADISKDIRSKLIAADRRVSNFLAKNLNVPSLNDVFGPSIE